MFLPQMVKHKLKIAYLKTLLTFKVDLPREELRENEEELRTFKRGALLAKRVPA